MNDDLISRKQVISFLKDLAYDKDMGYEGATAVCMACGGIDRMPAVEAEPVVHSKWEMIPVNGVACYRCGNINCARLMPFGCVPHELPRCPNCGAKMDKEENT